MTYKLFDIVTTTEALPDFGVGAEMSGTVVDVNQDGDVEVEFCNNNGESIAIVPLSSSKITLADIRKAA